MSLDFTQIVLWLLKSNIILANAGKWLTRSRWFRKLLKRWQFYHFFETDDSLKLPPVPHGRNVFSRPPTLKGGT